MRKHNLCWGGTDSWCFVMLKVALGEIWRVCLRWERASIHVCHRWLEWMLSVWLKPLCCLCFSLISNRIHKWTCVCWLHKYVCFTSCVSYFFFLCRLWHSVIGDLLVVSKGPIRSDDAKLDNLIYYYTLSQSEVMFCSIVHCCHFRKSVFKSSFSFKA